MYNPISVANQFINRSIYDGVKITPMKVLKLVYIAHGWYLGFTKKPFISEQTEAWKYGPVISSVYQAFKKYGISDIKSLNFSNSEIKSDYKELTENDEHIKFLDTIWDVYKGFSGGELSNLTHQKETPWYITWNTNKGSTKHGSIIPNKLIQEYYEEKLAENE